ncbi:MAG: ribbon-helix-helix protein, CopG family [Mariprofundaceae bacterium]|nr:ribbon-helix-helix protein, CopG family [Mariprofundaceae bacterium]
MLSEEVKDMHSVSVKLNDDDYSLLDDMAQGLHKSRAEIISEALKTKLAYEAWKEKEVLAGLADIEAGRTVSSDDIDSFCEELKARNGQYLQRVI